MKTAPNLLVECYRQPVVGARTQAAGNNGAFRIPCGEVVLTVIASDGGRWDHISVSLPDRCPTWEEMCHVKDLFFRTDEWAIQYHPPRALNVNNHPYCLHLWRSQSEPLATPPAVMVGDASLSPE